MTRFLGCVCERGQSTKGSFWVTILVQDPEGEEGDGQPFTLTLKTALIYNLGCILLSPHFCSGALAQTFGTSHRGKGDTQRIAGDLCEVRATVSGGLAKETGNEIGNLPWVGSGQNRNLLSNRFGVGSGLDAEMWEEVAERGGSELSGLGGIQVQQDPIWMSCHPAAHHSWGIQLELALKVTPQCQTGISWPILWSMSQTFIQHLGDTLSFPLTPSHHSGCLWPMLACLCQGPP